MSHFSFLKPFSPSVPGTEEPAVPPPPEFQEEPSIYQVREILDSRRQAGHLEYLIDWEGYGPEERSWVAQYDVLDPPLLTDFHHSHQLAKFEIIVFYNIESIQYIMNTF